VLRISCSRGPTPLPRLLLNSSLSSMIVRLSHCQGGNCATNLAAGEDTVRALRLHDLCLPLLLIKMQLACLQFDHFV